MSDRDRLIELCNQKISTMKFNNSDHWFDFNERISEIADYLIANGVIVPPVEEGQIVWYVDDFTNEIEECKVYGFNVVNGKFSVLVDNGEEKWITRKWHNTKEEAEEKLKELRK